MTREEFQTAAGVYFERLLLATKDLPSDRLGWPMDNGHESALTLFENLRVRAERMVRALEMLFHGNDTHILLSGEYVVSGDLLRSLANFRIAHTTVMAAAERVPLERMSPYGEIPDWLNEHYLTPLEQAVPRIENWANSLRSRGQAGPTGLPVIQ